MRNIRLISSILAVLLFSSICLNAQKKPIWLVGHRCNSQESLAAALEDGGNGVEIDVRTPNNGAFWCVDHDYAWAESSCDGKKHLSLKQYLELPELKYGQFCLLWIDCKFPNLKELVEYVHANIPNDIKGQFAITYSRYALSDINYYVMVNGIAVHILDWLKENLWENEGISLGWERNFDEYKALLDQHNFPYEKHFFTDGTWHSKKIKSGTRWHTSLKQACTYRDAGQFCRRVGMWTASTAYDAYWFFDPKYANLTCDAVMAECRKTVHIPFTSPTALKYCRLSYIDKNADKFKVADRNDTKAFFKK